MSSFQSMFFKLSILNKLCAFKILAGGIAREFLFLFDLFQQVEHVWVHSASWCEHVPTEFWQEQQVFCHWYHTNQHKSLLLHTFFTVSIGKYQMQYDTLTQADSYSHWLPVRKLGFWLAIWGRAICRQLRWVTASFSKQPPVFALHFNGSHPSFSKLFACWLLSFCCSSNICYNNVKKRYAG